MSDELLPYYNQELSAIRTLGAEFAERHPKIASRLRLSADASQDPHIERLIEAFAYLSARIRHKLDDDFPEIADALLGTLYPHFLAPLPSMSIVQLALDRSQADLTTGHRVERGTTIETERVDGEPCTYQTSYATTLWPCRVERAGLTGRPFAAPTTFRSSEAAAVLKLELNSFAPAAKFSQFDIGTLRFYLHAAQSQNVQALYELLFNNTLEIALASGPDDRNPVVLPASALRPAGFDRLEAVLPDSPRSFPGYRLLSEYFALPQKFLFVDLVGLDRDALQRIGSRLEIYVYLDRRSEELERSVQAGTFRLGCTPVVNLFKQRADSFVLTQTETEYRIIPDARRSSALEIYSVDRVVGTSPAGEEFEFLPFYSTKHALKRSEMQTFWHAVRKPAGRQQGRQADQGTEVYLSLIDLGFSPAAPANWTVDVETTCLNRDLPRRIPFGGGRPALHMPDGKGPVGEIQCLVAPTPTLRPGRKRMNLWRLVSHLSLNHLSLADDEHGAEALREILRLHDRVGSAQNRDIIDGLARVRSRRVVGRAGGAAGGFCRGLEIEVDFDDEKFSGSGAYLFGTVLDRFLGMYASMNSFTTLIGTSERRRSQGDYWRWPPRAGEKTLL